MNRATSKQVARLLAEAEGNHWHNQTYLVRLLSFALKLRELGVVAGHDGVGGRKACRQLVRLLVRLVADPVKVEVEAYEAGHEQFVRLTSLTDVESQSEAALRRRRMLMRRRVEQAKGAYFDTKRLNQYVLRLIRLYCLNDLLVSTALYLRSSEQVGGDITSGELQRWLDWAEYSFFRDAGPGLGDILEEAISRRSIDAVVDRALSRLDTEETSTAA